MMISKKWMSWVTVALLGMSACSNQEGNKQSASDTPSQKTTSNHGQQTRDQVAAYNNYVAAHNAINGMFYGRYQGINNLLQAYKQQDFKRSKDPILYLNTSLLGNFVNTLTTATQADSGSEFPALQSTGKTVLASAKTLQTLASELENYIQSKKYLDDNFALINAKSSAFIAAWSQFNQDYTTFSQALSDTEKARRLAAIKKFEAEGNVLDASRAKSLLAATSVLELIRKPADLKDPAKVKQADDEIKKLEAALDELSKANASNTNSDSYKYKNMHERLTQFTGYWRSLKSNPSASTFNDMIERYNDAVQN